jgi:[protein-PII] uridylyltransferase
MAKTAAALAADIGAALAGITEARAARSIAVQHLLAHRLATITRLTQAFEAAPTTARPLTAAIAALTDTIVCTAFLVASRHLHPLANPTDSERMAVLAVGGYGRAEMAPASDVDLLFLTPWKVTPWAESVIESMLYILWDVKLKVGHASRTVKDCLRLAREDMTIRTALLEHRFIIGDTGLGQEVGDRLWADLFSGTGPEFIEAKLAAMCWNPMSRKAKAACAICRRFTGSANTFTGCQVPTGWSGRAC